MCNFLLVDNEIQLNWIIADHSVNQVKFWGDKLVMNIGDRVGKL